MAMAAAVETVAEVSVSAQVVGNAFVGQYYHILYHSPELAYRFYLDISKLGRPELDGSMGITSTMQAINEKIISLNYGELKPEIKSVDSQESFNGGVHVLVTGHLTGKDHAVRKFAQTFFLAPQVKGYFVLNDMFRYLDSPNLTTALVDDVVAPVLEEPIQARDTDAAPAPVAAAPPAPVAVPAPAPVAVPAPAPALIQENHLSEESTAHAEEEVVEVYNPPENGNVIIVEEEIPLAEVVDEVQDDAQKVVESRAKIAETTKKSYASIVMHHKETSATFSPPPAAARKAPSKNVDQVNLPVVAPADGQVSSVVSIENENNQEDEAFGQDGYSIYIKGLPMNASVPLLEEVFKKFGTIKSDGIQVRSNRQNYFCFGFVEFEEASSVEKALEASPVLIGGRQAFVEEKKSTNSRGNNRGRFQPGRGSGFRSDGGRGRGNYGGGRGYNNRGDFNGNRGGDFNGNRAGDFNGNRGDFNGNRGDLNGRNEFVNRGGNRGGSATRDGYQRSDSFSSNGGGRTNRIGGMANGNGKNMAPRVSATA